MKNLFVVCMMFLGWGPLVVMSQDCEVNWAKTLEFSYPIPGDTTIQSGIGGNVTLIKRDTNDVGEKFLEDGQYSVARVHQEFLRNKVLREDEVKAGRHNLVVVGTTLFVRVGVQTYGFFDYIRDDKRFPFVFVSGTDSSLPHKRYKLVSHKYGAKKETVPTGAAAEAKPSPSLQESSGYSVPQTLKDIDHQLALMRSTTPSQQVNEAAKYWEMWRVQQLGVVSKYQEQLGQASHSCSVIDCVENVQNKLVQQFVTESRDRIGSLVDSERYFLLWWHGAGEAQVRAVGAHITLMRSLFVEAYQGIIGAKYAKHISGTEDMPDLESLQTMRENFQKRKELGVIFHLHSQREMCLSCAASVAMALFSKEIEALQRTYTLDLDQPFFIYLMVSCDQKLEQTAEQTDTEGRPPGIGNHAPTLEGVLDIQALIEKKVVPQNLLITTPASSPQRQRKPAQIGQPAQSPGAQPPRSPSPVARKVPPSQHLAPAAASAP